MRAFSTADILLPAAADMEKWACVACDQFTSEPEYWEQAERIRRRRAQRPAPHLSGGVPGPCGRTGRPAGG